MDLDSIPPRASLVHPADDVSQSKRSSVSSRPLPTIPSAASGNSCDNIQTNRTSAQQLYATAMTSNSSHSTSPPTESVPISEVPIGPIDQPVSMLVPSILDRDTTSQPLTQASSSMLPSSTLVTAGQGHSQPRSRRIRESRRMAHPLSLSSLSATEGSTGQTLYNPAVQTSTLGTKPRLKPQYDVQQGLGPNKATWDASLGISRREGHNIRKKPLPPTPVDGKGLLTTRTTSNGQHTTRYSGITEDNTFFMPAEGRRVSSTERGAILIDEVPLFPVSPIESGLQQPIASSSFTGSRSTDQEIFQPRPIKPLQGLSASFQDQIRETEASQPTPNLEENVARRKMPLFKRFSVDLIRTASGKSIPDKDIRQGDCRPSQQYNKDSSWMPIVDSSLDESFVLIGDAAYT